MKRFLCISSAILLLSIQVLDAQAASIQVDITGFESSKGQVMVQLYDGISGWSEEQSLKDDKLAIEEGRSTWQLDDLPPGKYAIRCFHDKNENQELDTNFLGIPKEAYGFSNNARGSMGPPSWEAVHFLLETDPLTLNIEMN